MFAYLKAELNKQHSAWYGVLAAAFMLAVVPAALAQNETGPLIEVQTKVDTSVITIGDRINYSIIINRDTSLRIVRPAEGINLGMFEIKDYTFHDPVEEDGRVIERFDFNISVYDTGHFVIPPYPVAYFTDDTSKNYRIIEAPAVEIYVKSLLTGDEERELKDIKPPLSIPFNYWFWASMAAAVVLLGVIGWLAYRLWKKKQEQGYLFKPPPPPPPAHETALAALQELFASDLLEKKNYKQYYSRLSDIMRQYVEGRFAVAAMEEITGEIIRDLDKVLDDKEQLAELEELLTLADLVKFAKYIPQPEETEKAGRQAVRFVEETKLVFEPPADAEVEEREKAQYAEAEEHSGGKLPAADDSEANLS
ncbi:MAG TPA: hypothetical protein ENK44_10950 [Caldithrix abyssi]|uniref:Protein BatD n=1 Tax=Caldithrix abyssi TaxID=187145 RepID=A0A7V4U1K2_CALAY|nr:hypothetical protein [Caldithrix abyssi]